ncbi:MAG: hypothetical protein QF535_22480, partial [Anaerolineales bacterium]|nr:hypothetical protein [Anaerolineales bacterium]
ISNYKCHTNEDQGKCTKQPAATVEMSVKYHSNQDRTSLFIATNAFRSTNHKAEEVDLVEVIEVGSTEAQEMTEMTDQGKCTKQPAATVEMSAKCHSSQKRTDLYIATNASQIIEKIKTRF